MAEIEVELDAKDFTSEGWKKICKLIFDEFHTEVSSDEKVVLQTTKIMKKKEVSIDQIESEENRMDSIFFRTNKVHHTGTKGDIRETLLSTTLSTYLEEDKPSNKIRLIKGLLRNFDEPDEEAGQSGQIDIIIALTPKRGVTNTDLANFGVPLNLARCAIEVKSTLNITEIRKANDELRIPKKWGLTTFLFAFRATDTGCQSHVQEETVLKWVKTETNTIDGIFILHNSNSELRNPDKSKQVIILKTSHPFAIHIIQKKNLATGSKLLLLSLPLNDGTALSTLLLMSSACLVTLEVAEKTSLWSSLFGHLMSQDWRVC